MCLDTLCAGRLTKQMLKPFLSAVFKCLCCSKLLLIPELPFTHKDWLGRQTMCEVTTFETRLTGTLVLMLNSCHGRSRVLAEVAPETEDKSRELCVQLLSTALSAQPGPRSPEPRPQKGSAGQERPPSPCWSYSTGKNIYPKAVFLFLARGCSPAVTLWRKQGSSFTSLCHRCNTQRWFPPAQWAAVTGWLRSRWRCQTSNFQPPWWRSGQLYNSRNTQHLCG